MRGYMIPALAALAAAAPVERTTAHPNDAEILNYALTLEHLEATFYAEGIKKLKAYDFEKIGVPSEFYANLQEIASDEATHVTFLTSALQSAGYGAVAACTYDFGYTDAEGFLQIASILEGTGVSAYLGAAQYITSKEYLTAAGAILTVEARHSAYLRDNQRPQRESPFPSPFDIPLDFDEVYSLAAGFITGCPAGNAKLLPALKAFPALAVKQSGELKAGMTITVTAAKAVAAKAAYFITTLGPVAAQLQGSGTTYQVTIPSGVQAGQEYLVLTKGGAPTDDTIVAGPALVPIADNDANAPGGSYPHGGWWGGHHGHHGHHGHGHGKPPGYGH